MAMSIADICKTIVRDGESRSPAEGITTHSLTFYSPVYQDRVVVDCAKDYGLNEWEALDTHQDAPYFGCWFSRKCLAILTLCEGDWTYDSAMTLEEFEAYLTQTRAFYDRLAGNTEEVTKD